MANLLEGVELGQGLDVAPEDCASFSTISQKLGPCSKIALLVLPYIAETASAARETYNP